MKIYKKQSEIRKDIKNGVLVIEGDVTFECSFAIDSDIVVTDGYIKALDITARNITAWNIDAIDIKANNITAWDIDANNITALNIDAWNIEYNALCFAYNGIRCSSIKSTREKHQEPICLEGKLEIKKKFVLKGQTINVEIEGKIYTATIQQEIK